MLDLGRQMEVELQPGVLGNFTPTVSSSALVLANAARRRDGGRLETISATDIGEDGMGIALSNQHPGVLTDSGESGVKALDGGMVRRIVD